MATLTPGYCVYFTQKYVKIILLDPMRFLLAFLASGENASYQNNNEQEFPNWFGIGGGTCGYPCAMKAR